jgi:hypothetical protein
MLVCLSVYARALVFVCVYVCSRALVVLEA